MIKSVEALEIDKKICRINIKNKKMDAEEGKLKLDTIDSIIELSQAQK